MGTRTDASKSHSDRTLDDSNESRGGSKAAPAPESRASRKAAAKAAAEAEKATSKAEKASKAAAKLALKANAADSKNRRAEAKANKKAATAAAKASKAAGKASVAAAESAATKPARLVSRLTDPKIAKRAVTIGKILVPALAPMVLKAAVGGRGLLDGQRARKLGVPVEEVAAYRGPTGPAGARIAGLTDSIRELASRKGNDLQVTRFTDVASTRLRDLTAAVQACASMPKPKRNEVLRAVSRELDEIDADLVTHLMAPLPRP